MKKITTIALFILTGLVCTVNAQDYSSIIKEYLAQKTSALKTNSNTYNEWEISNIDPSTSLKATVINIQQKMNGVPVMYSDAVLVLRDGAVITEKDNFSPLSSVMKQNNSKPSLNIDDAINITQGKNTINNKKVDGHLVYYLLDGQLVLSWRLGYHSGDLERMTIVDANTGSVIHDEVTTISCNFRHDEVDHGSANINPLNLKNENTESSTQLKQAAATATYNVFAFPVEAPTFGPRSLITDPWMTTSSPIGWHNDGDNSYNTTKGNNVYAYDDSSGINEPGNSPFAANLVFNYPLNINENAQNYKDAAITNLFYVNNMMHDVFYSFGFTETAKNFQNSNLGKGGTGGDYVRAEAQDGGGLDNANFGPGYEGSSILYPRMQMYLWSPKAIQNIFITSPAAGVSRDITSKLASFGPSLESRPTTGILKLTQPVDGCTALTNGAAINGNIALVERGSCNFVMKVKTAQDAGATAVVIYNPLATSTFGPMGGTDATISIPSILIKNDDADYLKSLMTSQTVTIKLEDDKTQYKYVDGSLDNGIVIHEYGHGITNRMTGTGYGCLSKASSAEQMGEGWSDYFAMMLTYQPGATAQVARGVGTFATGEATTGSGIRPAKYSPDFAINNFTYADTNTMSYQDSNNLTQIDVHSVGFVYATILWDMTWKMIDKYGYAADVINNKTAGNAKALQLVVDALKLQGCNPGFIEGRDAIIQADALANSGQNECLIWGAFAKRGVGVNAAAGNKKLITDQIEDFTYPAKCNAELSTTNVSLDENKLTLYPNPAIDQFYIKNGTVKEKLLVSIYNMSGGLVSKTYVKDGEPVNVRNLTKGVYLVNIEGLNFKANERIIINN